MIQRKFYPEQRKIPISFGKFRITIPNISIYFRFLFLFSSFQFFSPINHGMAFQNPLDLFDFRHQDTSGRWMIVNDGVMGGVSESRLFLDEKGFLVFEGRVSLDYGGGFASVRSLINELDANSYQGILIKFRGDGKKYQLRLRHQDRIDGVSYFQHFQTEEKKWMEVLLPFSRFQASYRGRLLPNHRKLDTKRISQIGLMISDKQEGLFQLEIGRIALFREENLKT